MTKKVNNNVNPKMLTRNEGVNLYYVTRDIKSGILSTDGMAAYIIA
jgi:hypothetical protein